MATCLDYAKIAVAAYYKRAAQYYEPEPGHMVDNWVCSHWESGTWYGNGFQGGIYQNAHEVVVGCCGTNTGSSAFLPDLTADLRIAFKILPNQSSSAMKMLNAAKGIAGSRRVSVSGHSLGGGLAQVVAVWGGVPFVTFNAPAMRHSIQVSKVNVFKPMMMARSLKAQPIGDTPGVNFRIEGDVVSSHFWGAAGDHVGTVVDLGNATGGGAHGKGNIWQAVLETDWAFIDPFEGL